MGFVTLFLFGGNGDGSPQPAGSLSVSGTSDGNGVHHQPREHPDVPIDPSGGGRRDRVSATLENEADPTLENEATGSCLLVCRVLGSDAWQGVDAAVA